MTVAQAGDRAAYETLLRDCIPLIRSVARQQRVPADRIDDVVQDTLLTIHRVRQTYDPKRSFAAWLSTIARRRAIDVLRTSFRHGAREVYAPAAYETYPHPSKGVDWDLEQVGSVGVLSFAIAALPAMQREAVRYLVLEDRSLAEAAMLTGRAKGALKVNLHRALKKLRAGLSGVS
jgi:RNA polymerase sigma factor (sigma-70 family)